MKNTFLKAIVLCGIALTSQAQLNITQTSYKNYAKVTQSGGTGLILTQTGTNGTIAQTQTPGGANDNLITITQAGFYDATKVNQTGATNTITLAQNNSTGVYSIPSKNGNSSWLDQKGTGNEMTVTQTATQASTTNTAGNLGTVNQDGTDNTVTLTQTSVRHGNIAVIDQLAAASNSTITLTSSWHQKHWTLKQESGDGNMITVTQDNVNKLKTGNTATITQMNGDNNIADLAQTGYENTFTLTQNGSGNLVTAATQDGSANTATLTQTGTDNVITFSQAGTGNTATLTQNNAL